MKNVWTTKKSPLLSINNERRSHSVLDYFILYLYFFSRQRENLYLLDIHMHACCLGTNSLKESVSDTPIIQRSESENQFVWSSQNYNYNCILTIQYFHNIREGHQSCRGNDTPPSSPNKENLTYWTKEEAPRRNLLDSFGHILYKSDFSFFLPSYRREGTDWTIDVRQNDDDD